MLDDEVDWDEEFADDPDYRALTPAQRDRLLSVMEKMLEMGMAAVYGDEDEGVPESSVDCARCLPYCRARCCRLIFALTRAEAAAGRVRHNPQRPYFVARDADGYCPHLDRRTFACTIRADRPLCCRRYDCRDDANIWPDVLPAELRPAFPEPA